MLNIDKYAYGSRIANWSPMTKALLWLVGMVVAFQPFELVKPVAFIIVAGITIWLTRISVRRYLHWFYVILPFLLLSIVGIVFTISNSKTNLIAPLPIFGTYLGLSKSMLPLGIKVALRSLTAIACTYWFALSTPFVQVIQVLKKLHLPKAMIEVTMLMYRFIFIFIDAFEQIYRAQKLRFGYDSMGLMIQSSGILAKMLFEQVIINYQMMTKALDAKLYDGDFYV
ncbi:cobalt ECF transporter T component CbiQ [Lactobacillus sp. 3B(2020)]|uniref:cobalt ECF transporter T component CbiQ n=1 Tax=Lactobacillus sp. 3B(2020) TaxID=2695882 RepID=UPI0015DF34AE|nr:cobalt ECF transporter T component CbiQ [Lactobacillus sp. 3B(2020)]QLL69182.1 cobalt ECF transporter T component CbiQ [Lactobacillus sp. 3B(2020)]